MTNTGAWGVQVLVALLATASASWEAEAMDTIETRMTTRFVAFEREQDPALVQASLDELAASQDALATSDADVAAAFVRWLRFFEGLDTALDPHWQAHTPPVQGVPLPTTHGVVYPSREVDPASIVDPTERARYVAALQASLDTVKRYGAQLQLRRIAAQAMALVQLFFGPIAAASAAARERFERQLAASRMSAQFKQQLRATFGSDGAMK